MLGTLDFTVSEQWAHKQVKVEYRITIIYLCEDLNA